MRRQRSQEEVPLPRWARINSDPDTGPYNNIKNNNRENEVKNRKRQQQEESCGNANDEELYIRCASYNSVEQMIDTATRQCVSFNEENASSVELVHSVTSFLASFQPNFQSDENRNESEFLSRQNFDPAILPIVVIRSSSSLLDRRELVNSMQLHFMNMKSSMSMMSPAVCVVRNGPVRSIRSAANISSQIKPRSHADFMRDILLQCIAQETNPSQYTHLLERRKRKNKRKKENNDTSNNRPAFFASVPLSYTESLIEWAALTEEFNSIVIIVENPETIPTQTLDSILGIMSNLRSTHGLPISLVNISFREAESLSHVKRSSLLGESGVAVKEFDCPSSDYVFDQFMEKVDENLNIPILFGAKILPKLHECFKENHCSTVTTAQEMKKIFAHHFARPGSFLSLVQCPEFVACHWQRLAWLCLDNKSRESIAKSISSGRGEENTFFSVNTMHKLLQSGQTRRCMLSLMLGLIQKASSQLSLQPGCNKDTKDGSHSSLRAYTMETPSFETIMKTTFDTILESSPRENIEFLSYWFKELERVTSMNQSTGSKCAVLFNKLGIENYTPTTSFLKTLKQKANELTVLFGKIDDSESDHKDRADIKKKLNEALAALIYEVFLIGLHPEKQIDGTFPLSSVLSIGRETEECTTHLIEKSLHAELRRSIAMALSSPDDDNLSNRCDSCTAFQTLKGRSASMTDWFHDFCAFQLTTTDKDDWDIMKQRDNFYFGMYQLIHCGIVSKMSNSRRNDEGFERVSMVWTSGT